MTRQAGGGAARLAGQGAAALDLIHRSNCSKPALARVSGRLTARVSYREGEVSQAVIEAAMALALKLAKGGYGPTR